MKNEVIKAITRSDDNCTVTITTDKKRYTYLHHQSCCESCEIVDVLGTPRELEEKTVSEYEFYTDSDHNRCPVNPTLTTTADGFTWSILQIVAGGTLVRIIWLGESNGYYGEAVSVEEKELT